MRLNEIVAALESIAPVRYAEPWDNVGLLVGDPARDIARVMFCIDYTPEVACEAAGAGCDLIIAYHPPLFAAIKKITAPSAIYDAIVRGVAIYSPHTAWDVAAGGSNEFLADVLQIDLDARRPIRLTETKDSQLKLITFVPNEHVDAVSQALFDAGAGIIGDYAQCSFRSPGQGTFFGDAEKTNPTVGQSGKLERADEIRVETVVPLAKVEAVLAALRRSHPYEEPAFDLVRLAAAPEKIGQGRIGDLPPTSRLALFDRIRRSLAIDRLMIAGPTEGNVTRAACVAGAGGEFLDDAIRQGAELFLTGEIRHHDALAAARREVTVVCTLHSNSERASLARLRDRLASMTKNLPLMLSERDCDPFTVH